MSIEQVAVVVGEVQEHAEESTPDEQTVEQTEGTVYNATTMDDKVFAVLRLKPDVASEVQVGWKDFLSAVEGREAVGEAIGAALFDAVPSLQSLFKTPRAIMAMHFMNGLSSIIGSLTDPKDLKVVVETLTSFIQHLDLEVTEPRVVIFRDAIVDLLVAEMGERLSQKAKEGFATMLNYVGGSYIFIRREFAARLTLTQAGGIDATRKEDEIFDEKGHEGAGDVQAGEEGGRTSGEIASAGEGGSDDCDEEKFVKAANQEDLVDFFEEFSFGEGSIVITTVDGIMALHVSTEPDITVAEFKQMVEGETGFAPSLYYLMTSNGKPLANEKAFIHYGITSDVTLIVGFRLFGGVKKLP